MCGLPPVFGLRWLGGDRWLLIGPNGPWASWWRLPINGCDWVRCAVLAAPNDIARRRAALRRLDTVRNCPRRGSCNRPSSPAPPACSRCDKVPARGGAAQKKGNLRRGPCASSFLAKRPRFSRAHGCSEFVACQNAGGESMRQRGRKSSSFVALRVDGSPPPLEPPAYLNEGERALCGIDCCRRHASLRSNRHAVAVSALCRPR